MSGFTPMMEQYRAVKKEYADCILFFRLGDFYEMFFEDAETASRELEIVLTARDGGAAKVPMCGVPYHAADTYIGRLLEKGFRVAICDQVEDPKDAKGIVRREVTRVVTPGTALEEAWVKNERNYLLCVITGERQAGIAFVDLSTGEFGVCQFEGQAWQAELQDEFARLKPTECLVPRWDQDTQDIAGIGDSRGLVITEVDPELFSKDQARRKLAGHFGPTALALSGLSEMEEALRAAGAILAFIETTQRTVMDHIRHIKTYQMNDFMGIDKSSRRNLELTATLREGKKEGSLLAVLDHTRTVMGRRTLRAWLDQPLLDKQRIDERQDAVQELLAQREQREALQECLGHIRDLERIAAKIGAGMVNPRECLALVAALQKIPEIKDIGRQFHAPLLQLLFNLDEMADLSVYIEHAIDEQAPAITRDGGMIKTGYHDEVDALKKLAYQGDQWLIDYERSQKEATGIKTLKVGFNKVFGYYIEISRASAKEVPSDYVRKQTLVNAERFITDELKHFENEVLGAKEKLLRLELALYGEIKEYLRKYIEPIQTLAMMLAQLDTLSSLAEAAFLYGYNRPVIAKNGGIIIKGGRHPVVERVLDFKRFVPNDVTLEGGKERIGIVTGPNMGGKSTFLRQTALIVIMAQMGSFVPAEHAVIGIVDRVFTRVGAGDDLAAGQSTFMMEMVEVASILRYATNRSLVLLDEVGRGTSTYDGMSLARAIVEYLADRKGPMVLFATHYHELTDLAVSHSAVFNLCVVVKESDDEVIFLKKVIPGKADKSYGIHVAQMAGLPGEVTERAKHILAGLQQTGSTGSRNEMPLQPSLFGDDSGLIMEAIKQLDLNRLTPLQALNAIQEWQELLLAEEIGIRASKR